MSPSLLEIRGLRIEAQAGVLVHGVDLQLRRGEVCTLVGASGSGKSLSCLGLLDHLLAVAIDWLSNCRKTGYVRDTELARETWPSAKEGIRATT